MSAALKLLLPRCAAVLLLFSTMAVAQPAQRTLLLLPFENASNVPGIAWIGESFAEVLGRRLASPTLFVIDRDERLYAMERMGIAGDARLSRATLFRVGETLDLDYIVTGRYHFDGRVLTASAQLLDMRSLRLSPEVEQAGPLVDLIEIQSALAWNLLRYMSPDLTVTQKEYMQAQPRIRLDALENHIRGILAPSRADRIRHLREAVRVNPGYAQALMQLGKTQFEARDYSGAASTFASIPADDPWRRQAQFHLALAAYYMGDFARAARALEPLAVRFPLTEVHNNLGVVAARRGDASAVEHFRRAVEADPDDPDYRFNLAVALHRAGEAEEALLQLRQAVALQPDDAEAAALLQALAGGGTGGSRLALERVRRSYDETAFRQLAMDSRYAPEEQLAQMAAGDHAAIHIQRGLDLLGRGFAAEAEPEFREAILLDPTNAQGHLGLAQLLEQSNDVAGARAELQAALRLAPSADAFLMLAALDLRENRREAAREHVQRALALEPEHEAALALARTIAEQEHERNQE